MSETVAFPAVPDGSTGTEQLTALARDAWEGKFGPGILTILRVCNSQLLHCNEYRLARIIDPNSSQFVRQGLEDGLLRIREGFIVDEYEKNKLTGFLSAGYPSQSGSLKHDTFIDPWKPDVIEVASRIPDLPEITSLLYRCKRWETPLDPVAQINLFGEHASFEPGETYIIGEEESRIGSIRASLVYLPTARWGWIGNCSHAFLGNKTWIVGVTDYPVNNCSLDSDFPRVSNNHWSSEPDDIVTERFHELDDTELNFLNTQFQLVEENPWVTWKKNNY